MDLRSIVRPNDAFQTPLTADEIEAIIEQSLGSSFIAQSAHEIGIGMYNTTYRIDFGSVRPAVFLRVAPATGLQFGSERHLMRNEYATAPWLRRLSVTVPTILVADWTHTVIPRDYLLQSLVPGIPAPEKLADYPKPLWTNYFRQLGQLTAEVHRSGRNRQFGRIIGPHHATLLEWVRTSMAEIVGDLEECGVDANDVRRAMIELARLHQHFDSVNTAALLTGDLWTANVLLAPDADVPTIVGAVDFDRAEWGDPLADWSIRMASRRSAADLSAFWDGYGARPDLGVSARVRLLVYEVRHLAAVRLENSRLGDTSGVASSYERVSQAVATLIGMDAI